MHCVKSMGPTFDYANLCFASHLVCSAFERLQVRNNVSDLTWIEAEFGHGRVTCKDPFGQGFLQIFDRITLVQRAERRRDRQWAFTDFANSVAA